MLQSRIRGYLAVMGAATLWGVSGVVAKSLFNRRIEPWTLIEIRLTASFATLLVILALRRHPLRVSRSLVGRLVVLGLAMTASQFSYYLTISLTDVSTALFLQYTGPVFVTLHAWAVTRETITPMRGGAILLAVAGAYFLVAGREGIRIQPLWVLMHVGMINGPIAWLGTPRLARFAVVLVNVWSGLPFFGINFLAGLVTIPQELYEAATVDGAGSLVRFRRVTLPLLRPVLATVLLFSVVMTSSDFATIFVLTKGGPQNTTQILSTLAYKLGLATGDLGNAAAISLYLFPVLAVSTYVQVRLMRRVWQW